MADAGRDYISLDVTGRDVDDYDRMLAIEDAIVKAFGDRARYWVSRIDTVERIEHELRDPALILAASENRLPVMLVNISYRTEDLGPADFAPLEACFGLRLVTETIDRLS
jgi:hypothetical protein